MATIYISEFRSVAPAAQGGNILQVAKQPALTDQTVTIGATATSSLAFATATRVVRVHTDAICSFVIGSSPTATAAKARLAADQTEYFGVNPGDKLSVITNT